MEKVILYLVICEINLSIYIAFAKHEQYDGHSLYQINLNNMKETKIINDLVKYLYLDVWSRAFPGRPGHILVPKQSKEVFEISLNAVGINYKIEVDNIRDFLGVEDQHLKTAATRNQHQKNYRNVSDISFDIVYTYNEINVYLQNLANTYSNVKIVNGGNSFESRPIYYLKISTTDFQDYKKPIVMLQSLVHSREWVTSPVTLYAIHKLVVDNTEPDLLNNIDWIIVPVVNPDGYIYSHKFDRFWRKNRRTGLADYDVCTGVDLNRNFDINWASEHYSDACDCEFHGAGPMSEPETQVIAKIIMKYKSRIALFLDIHSFGSIILYAYGNGTLPKNVDTLHQVGVTMAQATDKVKVSSNPDYFVGNIAEILYEDAGSASDYAQAVGVPLSYSYELPAYKNNYEDLNGFLVNSKYISQTSFETWKGIAAGARYLHDGVSDS